MTMLAALPLFGWPQEIEFPASFEELADKAEEVVDVTLDANMLNFAGSFLSSEKKEEKDAKEIVKSLQGIYVRSFQFARDGEYSMEDVDKIREQLKGPEWVPIVNVRSKKGGDNAHIYLKKQGDKVVGLTVLAAEPRELTVVHIVGAIAAKDLAKLGGSFGIPKVNMGPVEKEPEN